MKKQWMFSLKRKWGSNELEDHIFLCLFAHGLMCYIRYYIIEMLLVLTISVPSSEIPVLDRWIDSHLAWFFWANGVAFWVAFCEGSRMVAVGGEAQWVVVCVFLGVLVGSDHPFEASATGPDLSRCDSASAENFQLFGRVANWGLVRFHVLGCCQILGPRLRGLV